MPAVSPKQEKFMQAVGSNPKFAKKVGVPQSVGPMWKNENSLGALKMVNVNVELIMPITSDYSTRGVVFYDGGSGWDTPNSNEINPANLTNNNFFYRHSFGVGIRMTSPTPLQIDFGIKLNPSKQFKNKLTYMHLNMIHEF